MTILIVFLMLNKYKIFLFFSIVCYFRIELKPFDIINLNNISNHIHRRI